MSRQYKTALEDAVKIMSKNKLVDKFDGLTNYRSASACHLNVSVEGEEKINNKELENYHSVANFDKLKRQQRGKISSIMSQYEEKKKDDNKKVPFFEGSVYERYRSKI